MLTARTELRIRQRTIRLAPFTSPRLQDGRGAVRDAYTAYGRGLLIIGALTFWLFGWLLFRWVFQPQWMSRLPGIVAEIVALAEIAGAFTLAFLWAGLGWRYWRHLREGVARTHSVLTLEKLYALSPKAFERYVAGLFRQKGYRVVVRGRSGDLGVDLELTGADGRRAIVQCKRYQNTIGAEIIRELYGTLMHERVIWAFLVTTADVSDAAREWAAGKPITLIDGTTLLEIANSLHQKNRKGVASALSVGS